jgi:poly(A) polymerase
LLACVLWQDVIDGWTARREGRKPFNKIPIFPALAESVDAVFEERIGDVSGRGKLGADMREIWMMQPRFEKRVGGSPHTLVAHLRFRAGFDFLRLRGESGEEDVADLAALASWWQDFQDADHAGRLALIEQAKLQPKSANAVGVKSTKPRRKRKSKSDSANGDGLHSAGL